MTLSQFGWLQNPPKARNAPGAREDSKAGHGGTEATDPALLKRENKTVTEQPPQLLRPRVLKQKQRNGIHIIYIWVCVIYIYKSEKRLVSYFGISKMK